MLHLTCTFTSTINNGTPTYWWTIPVESTLRSLMATVFICIPYCSGGTNTLSLISGISTFCTVTTWV